MKKRVIVVGSGNAALCAGIAALEKGAEVIMLEKADQKEAGGNSMYTAGAMRYVYNSNEDILPLLQDPDDERIPDTEFGTYTREKFTQDLLNFNNGRPISMHQQILIDKSYETMTWLSSHHIKFEPIYGRQCFEKDGKYIFWGGLTLAAQGEGVGLVEEELKEYLRLGGTIRYNCPALEIVYTDDRVVGVKTPEGTVEADSVILGCGGFQANAEMRKEIMGEKWLPSKVRGTRHNIGQGIKMALDIGAAFHGIPDGCHATPMDFNMPDYGNLEIPHLDRKNYRKICYFLGVMLNANGERFVDEGINFRNYTYAQFGKAILEQPKQVAWQIFDCKVDHLLYGEYRFWDATYYEADTIDELLNQIEDIDRDAAKETINRYNDAVDNNTPFDPTILDGKSTRGLDLSKSNWANKIDTGPFKAYPVTCGITFTYGGLKVDKNAAVLNNKDQRINGLYACGELVGGVFYHGYPGGSGLTSGAVFGRLAGHAASTEP